MVAVKWAAVVPFVAFIVGAGVRASLWPFLDHFLTPTPLFGGSLGVILAPLGSILVACGTPGYPKGTFWGQRLIFDGFWVPLGSPWGSLWDNLSDCFEFFCVKVGGWVADLLFKWFGGGKVTSAEWQNVVKPL